MREEGQIPGTRKIVGNRLKRSNFTSRATAVFHAEYPCNNVIRYNGETQIHSHRSDQFLEERFYEPQGDCDHLDPSSTFGGFNSAYDPDRKSYLVLTGKGSTATAIVTWWGQCPPDDNRFVTDGWPHGHQVSITNKVTCNPDCVQPPRSGSVNADE